MSTVMSYNKTSWIHAEDAILIEFVLDHSKSNKPAMDAYEAASEKLRRAGFNRSPSACSQRWWQIKGKVMTRRPVFVEVADEQIDELPQPTESIDDQYARKSALENEIVELESALHLAKARARTEKIYADINWFNRTTRSMNNKKIELKNLNIQINNNRKSTTEDEYKKFFEIAKVALDKEIFEHILSLSKVGKPKAPESTE